MVWSFLKNYIEKLIGSKDFNDHLAPPPAMQRIHIKAALSESYRIMHIFTTACCIIALVEKLQNSDVENLSLWMMSYDWVGSLSQDVNNQRPSVFDTRYSMSASFQFVFQ